MTNYPTNAKTNRWADSFIIKKAIKIVSQSERYIKIETFGVQSLKSINGSYIAKVTVTGR